MIETFDNKLKKAGDDLQQLLPCSQNFGFIYFKADTSNFKEPKNISEIDQCI